MNVVGADPHILFDKKSNTFYCYATSNDNLDKTFYIYKSKDLLNWEFVDYALVRIGETNWGKNWFWAPECYYNEKTGRYFLFYSARVKDECLKDNFDDPNYEEGCKIGVATSLSPEGPFINITNEPIDYFPYDEDLVDIEPLLKNKMSGEISSEDLKKAKKGYYPSLIDANVFFDDDGRIYLYFSRCCYRNWVYDEKNQKFIEESNILAVELDRAWFDDPLGKTMPKIKPQYISIDEKGKRKDKFKLIISYKNDPQDWENGHINDFIKYNGLKKNRRWSEGSSLFYKYFEGKKVYYITYSCNNFENEKYGVGVAISDSPLGPFKKCNNNPVIHEIQKESLYSTGHGSNLDYNNETYYIFHGRDTLDKPRILYTGKIKLHEDHIEFLDYKKCSLLKN